MNIINERKDNDKEVHSKALLLAETSESPSPRAAAAEPSPRAAASFVVPDAVLPTTDDEEDDFEVAIGLGVYDDMTLTTRVGSAGAACTAGMADAGHEGAQHMLRPIHLERAAMTSQA
jgi:hypothetical protein